MLRQLSIELKCNLRESDLAGRYGGDEFCVILPDQPLEQALDVQNGALASRRCIRLSASGSARAAGQPEYRPGPAYQSSYIDATAWLDDADKALYTSKNTGRNKVSVNPSHTDLETSAG